MDTIKKEIKEYFEANRNVENARNMKAYMRDQFAYYGIKSPVRRVLSNQLWRDHKEEIKANWQALVKYLWDQDEREYQMLAMDLMVKLKRIMRREDLALIEQLIQTKSWWDTVDLVAAHHVGNLLKDDKEFQLEKVESYMSSDNMWLQRTALIFQLSYKEDTDAELLYSLIDRTLGSREFFINKASGWALRQYSKFNPGSVKNYIDSRRDKLSGLTIREGSKYL